VKVGAAVTYSDSLTNGYMAATKLDYNTIILSYIDLATNNGITCVTINIGSDYVPVFGSYLQLTTGATLVRPFFDSRTRNHYPY
jgi:hypothetical protein